MILKTLDIYNYRNYKEASFSFSQNLNILYGKNGVGKTNILEAVYMLGRGVPFRTRHDNELVCKNGSEYGYFIRGVFKSEDNPYDTTVEISYKKENGKHTKRVFINKKEIASRRNLIGKLIFVLFLPGDTSIVEGSPSLRRDFLNMLISTISSEYLDVLIRYNKALKFRNKALALKSGDFSLYDEETAKLGLYIAEKSEKYSNVLEETMNDIYSEIFKGERPYKIIYKNSLNGIRNIDDYISKLKNTVMEQTRLGTTYFGPHRSEYSLFYNGKLSRSYSSQGEKRMFALLMKLAEERMLTKYRSQAPLLLIDDALLELDEKRRQSVLAYIKQKGQVFITVTETDKVSLISDEREVSLFPIEKYEISF